MHPYLFHSGHLLLPTFGVLAAIGLMSALSLSLRTAVLASLDREKLWDAGLFTILSAFVLSRLLLVATNLHNFLTYPILLLMVPSLTPTAIFLTAVAAVIYLRLHRLPLLPALDAWAPCATLVWVFLSLGHLAEGSDPGLATTRPWGLRIPPDTILLQPVALYAAVAAGALTLWLFLLLSRRIRAGETAALGLAATGLIQFVLTFLRQPYPYVTASAIDMLDPIQWLSLGMIVAAGLLLLWPRKPVSHAL